MELVKINASYLTVRIPLEERRLWENLLVLSEKYLMALPKSVVPPASIGCPQHAIFEPTHSLCWIYYRPYNQYRLYRMWLEGGSLFFRIPVGGLILMLVKGKEEFSDELKKNLREYLIREYPPKGTLNFDPSKFPVELYPYQLRAVYGAINYRRAIISAPP